MDSFAALLLRTRVSSVDRMTMHMGVMRDVFDIVNGLATAFTTSIDSGDDTREPCTDPLHAMHVDDSTLVFLTCGEHKIVLRDGRRVIKIAITPRYGDEGRPRLREELRVLRLNNILAEQCDAFVDHEPRVVVVQTTWSNIIVFAMPYVGAPASRDNFGPKQQTQLERAIYGLHKRPAHHERLEDGHVLVDDRGTVRLINPYSNGTQTLEQYMEIDLRGLLSTPYARYGGVGIRVGILLRYHEQVDDSIMNDTIRRLTS